MSNALLDAVQKETEPMYDAAVITDNGIEYWYSHMGNHANNGHSVTKFFISSAVGILIGDGKISLSDKVTDYFSPIEMGKTIDSGWFGVTVEHALQHKTGILNIPFGVDEDDDIASIGDDFLKYVFSIKIDAQPGTSYKYSDAAYYLLGRIVSKAAGCNARDFIRDRITTPLEFKQWGMLLCPQGYTIGGGGLCSRSDDNAKLGFVWANKGMLGDKRMIPEEYIERAMANDYACGRFRDTDIFVKTGAHGQCVAFSVKRKAAAAWHGYSDSKGNERNDRLLTAFSQYLDEKFGEIKE